MPRMPIQRASPVDGGRGAGHEPRAHAQASARSREPRGEPAGLLAERMRLGHDRELLAHVGEQLARARRAARGSASDDRLRGDGGDDRERGVEAAPDLLLPAPGEERRRAGVVLAVAAERDQRRLRGRARLLGPPGLHHVEDLDGHVPLAEDRRIGQQALGLALEQLADVGPGHRQAVHRLRRLRVVVAAVGERRAQRVALAGRHEDGVVADGRERRRGRALGLGRRAAQPAEHARQDAERDRRLEVPALAGAAGEQLAQRAQRRDLVLLVPERLEQRRVLLVGRADGLGRERADALGRAPGGCGPRARRRRRAPMRRASR